MDYLTLTDFETFIQTAENHYVYGPNCLIIGISSDINIFTHNRSLLNTNIEVYKHSEIFYLGGTIINFPNDLNLLYTNYGKTNFGIDVLNLAKEYLQSRNINAYISGNDLMIGDTKVASYTKRAHLNGWYQDIVHFSIYTDPDLVQSICTKPSKKIPGRLSDYNITANDLLSILNPYFDTLGGI